MHMSASACTDQVLGDKYCLHDLSALAKRVLVGYVVTSVERNQHVCAHTSQVATYCLALYECQRVY
jgi:hypothetical protein